MEDDKAFLLDNTMKSFELENSKKMKFSRGRSASMSVNSSTSDEMDRNYREGFTGPLTLKRHGQGENSSVRMTSPFTYTRDADFVFEPPRMPLDQDAQTPKIETGLHSRLWSSESNEVKNEHLMRSGQLGVCNDPYCTMCPKVYPDKRSRTEDKMNATFHNLVYGESKGFAERISSMIQYYFPGIINPHAKFMQRWNKLFVMSCLFATFLDPLFFFLLITREDHKCIVLNWPMTKALVVLRSLSDCIYLFNILLQFRLAYIAPDSKVVGAGALVDDPQKIAHRYMTGWFFFDLFVVLPLPQIIILALQNSNFATATFTKDILVTCIILQYIPRVYRSFPLLAGQSPIGFIFESAWSNFIINLLMFVLAGHAIGSCWYLLAVQRVTQCLRDVCNDSRISNCREFLDCGHGHSEFVNDSTWTNWTNNTDAASCFKAGDSFTYGIFERAVNLTTKPNLVTRYIYSLFWGFQQISTFAGNQEPSYFEWEVLFVMTIIGIGLILFALLIGNMQNFLQSLGRRRLEMALRHRDVEQWMRHRRLPVDLQSQVRQAERFHWAATQGVNEEMLMENLPDDLQRDVRRHLFKFVKKVQLFKLLDDSIVDVICERLRTTTFIEGGKIFFPGGLINKMVFIIRGEIESIGDDRIAVQLSEGGVCGEELLTWYLDHLTAKKGETRVRIPSHGCLSNRLVRCLTNVEAFVLRAGDLEEIASLFSRFLMSREVQSAIRYDSPYWRALAARTIQVAWRYRKKRMSRGHQP